MTELKTDRKDLEKFLQESAYVPDGTEDYNWTKEDHVPGLRRMCKDALHAHTLEARIEKAIEVLLGGDGNDFSIVSDQIQAILGGE